MERFLEDRITTAAEAVKCVQSGDRVYVGTASSFAYELMDALWERRDELENVTILCSMSLKPSKMSVRTTTSAIRLPLKLSF